MNRRSFFQSSLTAAGTLSSLAQTSPVSPGGHHLPDPEMPAHPNVIWILGDQLRAQALATNGDPNARTPCLDRAAINGVNFTQNISGYPLCCPFRGSMLTGLYPNHCVPGHEYPIPAGQKTIADVFNSHGYDTAYFGKYHLGGWKERDGRAAFFIIDPSLRGNFRTWAGYQDNDSQWDCWVHGGVGKDAFHYRLPGYETDEMTNLLIRYLKERGEEQKKGQGKPFFAVLSVQPPHPPYVAPESFMKNYNPQQIELRPNVAHSSAVRERARRDLAGYYAMLENLDWNYGRVISTLEELSLYFNTHVLFFADHGDMHGSHGQYEKTKPYEESIRTPMIISGGQPRYDGWKTGRVPALLNQVDIAPTTLGLCGIAKPSWMAGSDYSHYRIEKSPAQSDPDSAYLQSIIPVGGQDCVNTPYRGLVTQDGWKYVCFNNLSWLMFNLNEDPYEESNLAHNSAYRNERKRLIARLKQWVADTGDAFTIPED